MDLLEEQQNYSFSRVNNYLRVKAPYTLPEEIFLPKNCIYCGVNINDNTEKVMIKKEVGKNIPNPVVMLAGVIALVFTLYLSMSYNMVIAILGAFASFIMAIPLLWIFYKILVIPTQATLYYGVCSKHKSFIKRNFNLLLIIYTGFVVLAFIVFKSFNIYYQYGVLNNYKLLFLGYWIFFFHAIKMVSVQDVYSSIVAKGYVISLSHCGKKFLALFPDESTDNKLD